MENQNNLYETGQVPIDASGWTKTREQGSQYSVLSEDISTDVLVIGAGLTGASLALHLAEQDVSVVVVDAKQPGWGASGRNAGHVLPLLKDFKVIDQFPDQGEAFLNLFREHHNLPFDIADKYNIDCDAQRSGYLNAIRTQKSFDKFAAESKRISQRLGQTIETLHATQMREMTGSDYYPYGVYYSPGGQINPYLFTCGMVAAAQTLGTQIYANTEATSMHAAQDGWQVKMANGAQVTCERLVFCTNAYSTNIVPEFHQAYSPMTAYALSTKPLPPELREKIMPSRAALAQIPLDLNPLVIDEHQRIITASIPSRVRPVDAQWHFKNHLRWIHRTWPESKHHKIELESFWTGRVAMREVEFPGMYRLDNGVYGLMHFNAWGNVMAPLMARELANALVRDDVGSLPFPIIAPPHIKRPGKQEFIIRRLLIPAARVAQRLGVI